MRVFEFATYRLTMDEFNIIYQSFKIIARENTKILRIKLPFNIYNKQQVAYYYIVNPFLTIAKQNIRVKVPWRDIIQY